MIPGRSCTSSDCTTPAIGGLSRCSWVTLLAPLAVGFFLLLSGCSDASEGAAETPAQIQALAEASATRVAIPLDATEPIPMRVYSSPTCGCCSLWVEHLEANGFEVETQYREDMGQVKAAFGVTQPLASCHTGIVNGYLIEGHVPADDIRRLLAEAPSNMRGLAVPGMPVGSPGMEMGDRIDPYDVLAIGVNGETSVFASYGR